MSHQQDKQHFRNAILDCVPIDQRVQAAVLLDVLCMIERREGQNELATQTMLEHLRRPATEDVTQ